MAEIEKEVLLQQIVNLKSELEILQNKDKLKAINIVESIEEAIDRENTKQDIICLEDMGYYAAITNATIDDTMEKYDILYHRIDIKDHPSCWNTFYKDIKSGSIYFITDFNSYIPIKICNNIESRIILSNESFTFKNNINNPIKILVKDTDENSKTYNMYIENSNKILVAYTYDECVIFNNTENYIEIKIISGE